MDHLTANAATYLGYAGSLLVALSMTMNNIWRLRLINLAGASTMATYGYLIESVPVLLLNLFIVCIDLAYIVELKRRVEQFRIMAFPSHSYPYLQAFLEFYRKDIERYQPEFSLPSIANPKGFFILRNMVSVGLFIYSERENSIEIHLDYVVPNYRDLKNAHFAYDRHIDRFVAAGFRQAVMTSSVPEHQRYLQRVGFRRSKTSSQIFMRRLENNR
jgi:hypothetical protein